MLDVDWYTYVVSLVHTARYDVRYECMHARIEVTFVPAGESPEGGCDVSET